MNWCYFLFILLLLCGCHWFGQFLSGGLKALLRGSCSVVLEELWLGEPGQWNVASYAQIELLHPAIVFRLLGYGIVLHCCGEQYRSGQLNVCVWLWLEMVLKQIISAVYCLEKVFIPFVCLFLSLFLSQHFPEAELLKSLNYVRCQLILFQSLLVV